MFVIGFDVFFVVINVVVVCWRFCDEFNGEIGIMREKKVSIVIVILFIFGGIVIIVIVFYNFEIDDYFFKIDEMKVVFGVGVLLYVIFIFF